MKKIIILFLLVSLLFCTSCEKKVNKDEETSSVQTTAAESEQNPKLKITFLDVKKADCFLFELDGEFLMVDTGTAENYDTISEYLDSCGVKELKYIVVTHPDKDHFGSAKKIMNNYKTDKLYLCPRKSTDNDYEKMIKAAQKNKTQIIYSNIGDVIYLKNASFTVIAPGEKALKADNDNDASIVMLMKYYNKKILLMGDALLDSQNEILDSSADIFADVVKISHHGSVDALSYKLLERVNAKYAVISCADRDNGKKLPSDETVAALEMLGMDIVRTDLRGNIYLMTDGEKILLE